jgi:uncharacterized membrane protein
MPKMKPDTRGWLIPAALITLAFVPVVASSLRLAELAGNPDPTPDNARFLAAPLAIWLHGAGGIIFLVLGAFQFAPGRRGRWHRVSGRIAVASGLVGAGAGIWMTLTFPAEPANGPLLQAIRLVIGPAWVLSLILGLAAAIRRDIAAHRAWMRRSYALGMGAGTAAITFGLWYLVTGRDTPTASALTQLAAWLINLAVAEGAGQRTLTRRPA